MKRFQYRLEGVLDYKNQVLDNLKSQQAEIAGRVVRKQQEVQALKDEMSVCHGDFNRIKQEGDQSQRFRLYDMCLCSIKLELDKEQERLKRLKREEEAKKKEVVAAKIDTSRYEKLRAKQLREYNKAAMKAEEMAVEEFVSGKAIRAANRGRQKGAMK